MSLPLKTRPFPRIATSSWILPALLGLSAPAWAETIRLYFDGATPQIAFAAGDVKAVLEKQKHTVQTHQLSALAEGEIGRAHV
jgi:hypothetical protein